MHVTHVTNVTHVTHVAHVTHVTRGACLQHVAELDAGEDRIGETRRVDYQQDEVDVAVGQLALQVRLRQIDARTRGDQLAKEGAVTAVVACRKSSGAK